MFLTDLQRQVAKADLHVAALAAGNQRVPPVSLCRQIEKYEVILRGLHDSNVMHVLNQFVVVRFNIGERFSDAFRTTSRIAGSSGTSQDGVQNSQGGVDVGTVPGSPEFGVVLQDRDDDASPTRARGSGGGMVPEPPEFWFANRACASTDRPDPEVDFGSSDTVSVMGDQEPAPVDGGVVPPEPIVREPAPVMDAQPEPIVILAGPAWLSAARYDQTRHGPRNVDTLQETILKITAGRREIDSSREKGIWTFDFVKRQCLCQGCRGSMAKGTPGLGGTPRPSIVMNCGLCQDSMAVSGILRVPY